MGYSPWGCRELDVTEATEHTRKITSMPACIYLELPLIVSTVRLQETWGRGASVESESRVRIPGRNSLDA